MLTIDGFENVVANIATERDKAAFGSWSVIQRSPMEYEAMYRSGWLGRKIIDIPTDDMTRKWRSWDADAEFVAAVDVAEKKFNIRERIQTAKRWSRLFGSSAVIIGARPRLGRPDEPLDVASFSTDDLLYLHVEIAPYLTIRSWVTDLLSPDFGKPEFYQYQPFRHGAISIEGKPSEASVSVLVHASRVIPFAGMTLPPYAALQASRWGDSIFTAIEQTLNTAGSVTAVIASLLTEAKLDVIKVKDLAAWSATAEGEAKLKKRFSLAMMLKSVSNQLVLDADEDFDQKQIAFSGLSDVHIRMMQEISGAADIPVTRLLGQTPAGLHATGDSDLRNYYDHISAKQESEIRPQLERLDAILFANNGITLPKDASFRFRSLWQETPQQRADTALKNAQATKYLTDTGLLDDEAMAKGVISQLVEDGVYPGLDAALKESATDGIAPLDQMEIAPEPGPAERAAIGDAGFDPGQPRDDHGRWIGEGIDRVIDAAGRNEVVSVDLGAPTEFVARKLHLATGVKVSDFQFSISNQAIQHINAGHGGIAEAARGQRPVDRRDFANLPAILSHVVDVHSFPAARTGAKRATMAALVTRDRYTIGVEIRPRAHRIAVITMWKK